MDDRIAPHVQVVAAGHQVSCDLAGEAVILHLQDGVYYGLNPIGTRIWNLIREPKAVREILGTLLEEYDVAQDRCEQDLLTLLQELALRQLIEVRDDVGAQVAFPPKGEAAAIA